MTIASISSKVIYQGDAVTSEFPIPFPFFDNSHIEVRLRSAVDNEVVWVLGSEYTLAGAGIEAGGTLTVSTHPLDHTPPVGTSLVIRRVVPNVQEIDYPEGGAFPARAHEQGLDLSVMRDQQLDEALQRTLQFPVSDPAELTGILPTAGQRANSILGFDAEGNPIATMAPEGGNVVSSFMATMLDDADPADARSTLGAGAAGDTLFTAATAAMARAAIDAAALTTANVFTKTQTWKDGGNIASAASLTLGDGNIFTITGTTTITSIGTKGIGTLVLLRFASALTLTYHASDLVTHTGASIVTMAGDWAILEEYATGDWRVIHFSRPHVPYARLEDQKASGTSGGASTGAAWNTRTLNTEAEDAAGLVSLSSNRITLETGTYYVRASAPGYAVNGHKLRLRNITDGATALVGTTEYANGGLAVTSRSLIDGTLAVTGGPKAFELQQWFSVGHTNGCGYADATGEIEIFARIELWRLA